MRAPAPSIFSGTLTRTAPRSAARRRRARSRRGRGGRRRAAGSARGRRSIASASTPAEVPLRGIVAGERQALAAGDGCARRSARAARTARSLVRSRNASAARVQAMGWSMSRTMDAQADLKSRESVSEPQMRIGDVAATGRRPQLADPLLRGDRAAAPARSCRRPAPVRRDGAAPPLGHRRRAARRLSLDEIRELVDHGNDPMSDRLRALAEHRLPEIDALIERATRVRAWLEAATSCGCERIDDCALFDDAPLGSATEARPLAVRHVGGRP